MQLSGYGLPRMPLLGTRVNKAPAGHRASGRGTMEADLTNTTKEVLRAFRPLPVTAKSEDSKLFPTKDRQEANT